MSTWAQMGPPSQLQAFSNEPTLCLAASVTSWLDRCQCPACLQMSARSAEGSLWGAAEGYKGEQAPEGADVYTVNNNGGPGGAMLPLP